MRPNLTHSLLVLTLFSAAACQLHADNTTQPADNEVKVKLEDCPKAVQETIKSAVGTGTIKELVKENEDGKTIYSVDATIDSKPYEINIAEDGKLISKKLDNEDSGDKK